MSDEPFGRDEPEDGGARAPSRAGRRPARNLALAATVVVGSCLLAYVSTGTSAETTSDSLRSARIVGVPTTTTTPASSPPSTEPSDVRNTRPTVGETTVATSVTPATAPPQALLPALTAPPTVPPLGPPPPVVARPVPQPGPATPPPEGPLPPWAGARVVTAGGYVGTPVGCASDTSAAALDDFFRSRLGPVVGHDYQHVYALGGDRYLWLFQDTFLDHSGTATTLDQTSFAHNTAMEQRGTCFTVLHRGTADAPASFEPGTGERLLSRWFWPLGGETIDGRVYVFWAEMAKTADPQVPDGLGWVPVDTWLATYDASTLARLDFRLAPASGVAPIYGFAVSSDAEYSYLFGNTFDQNLARQGGYHQCPCSATSMWLARVPRGHLDAGPEYRTATGWSPRADDAQPFLTRYHAENPMQPRYLAGQWVAVTKVDGYWGEDLVVDVATDPWGPWTTVSRRELAPRGGDRSMNTYHAHLAPWLDSDALVIGVSQNARDMLRDAWPHPERYRLQFVSAALVAPPPPPPTPTTPTTEPPTTPAPATTDPSTTTSTSTTSTTTTTSTTSTTTTLPECSPPCDPP